MQALIALVLGALFGLGLSGLDLNEAVARGLREEVGEARRVSVAVEPSAVGGVGRLERVTAELDGVDARRLPLAALVPIPRPRALKGSIGALELHATDVHLDDLRASELSYTARGVTYDLLTALRDGEVRLTGIESERLTVVFRDGDLDQHFAVTYPEFADPTARVESGRLVLRAEVPFFLASFPMTLSGVPQIEDGSRLVLADPQLDSGRMQLSDRLREKLLAAASPLVDLNELLDFEVPLHWDEVTCTEGTLVLHGHLVPPTSPAYRPIFQPRARYER